MAGWFVYSPEEGSKESGRCIMELYGTLERSWLAVTPGGYPIRVEEHHYDLSYIYEFYDGDELASEQSLSHCPVSGEKLTTEILNIAEPEVSLA